MEFHHAIAWGIFLLVVLAMLAVDLLVLHRKPHAIHFGEAFLGVAIPVVTAMAFAVAIYFAYENKFLDLGVLKQLPSPGTAHLYPTGGADAALLFITGYLVELSMSADNVFLFVILMAFFKVPRELQHRVLFWGVLGALVMRGIMILAGAAILIHFEWIIYLFALFILYAAVKLAFSGEPKDPSDNLAVRMLRKVMPIKEGFEGQKFFTVVNGRKAATSLFLVLVCIEFTDLVFALDSIPAIFGITRDSFLVFSSNVFAILGLRSMYFLLAGVMDKFHLLKYGLAAVLGFVGVKMLLPAIGEIYSKITGTHVEWNMDEYKITSLAVIAGLLTVSILASLIFPSKKHHTNPLAEEPLPAK